MITAAELFERIKEMPEPWCNHFPKSSEEARAWKPWTDYRALHSQVLVVATTRVEGMWAAYCRSVPGMNHVNESAEVLRTGDKVDEQVARALFPQFEGVPYAH